MRLPLEGTRGACCNTIGTIHYHGESMSAKKNRDPQTGMAIPQEFSLSPSRNKMIEPELTPEQIADFWNAVRGEMGVRRLGDVEINESIERYRSLLLSLDAENAVYHDEPTYVADVLEAGIKHGHRSGS